MAFNNKNDRGDKKPAAMDSADLFCDDVISDDGELPEHGDLEASIHALHFN